MPTKKVTTKKVTKKETPVQEVKKDKHLAQHSPAILMALSYLIGFMTAYIAFALNNNEYHSEKSKASAVFNEAVAYEAIHAVITNDGLFMTGDGKQRVISARAEESDLSVGYHRDIVISTVSPNESFIHYCAVMEQEDACAHFVYSVLEDRVYPVMLGNSHLETSEEVAWATTWTANDRLEIGSVKSIDSSSPWNVE